jgi:[ribosomal protein S5]-alanine N-acetyltransferase
MTSERWFPIETDRLLLREFTRSDEADIHEYGSDPLVSRFDSWGPSTPEGTREFLLRQLDEQQKWPRDEVTLAAELRKECKLIGSIRLWITSTENQTAEFGYAFNRSYWNSGYATEAATSVLTRAFAVLKVNRISATCDVRNVASWRVMEKLGMRREGHFLQDKWQRGEWRDSYLYAILAPEWASRNSK